MKKLIATLITLVVLSMAALPVAAQTRGRCATRTTYNGRTDGRYDGRYNGDAQYRNEAYRNDAYQNDVYDPITQSLRLG